MNPTLYAARLGLARGWAEFRQSLIDPQQMGFQVFFAVAFVIVLLFQRGSTVEGTNVSLAFAVLPGVLGMMVAVGGLQGAAGSLAVEREDGTLLRAKAVPNGMDGLVTLPIIGVTAISGIFYPIFALPGWVQAIAQVFPIYWLGLGVRSAFLPDSAASVEIGESWRHLETVGVLGAWALVGLVLAPVVLRRMARKESGANMAARRQRALQRIG